jgi:hypothetical protein
MKEKSSGIASGRPRSIAAVGVGLILGALAGIILGLAVGVGIAMILGVL